jgi:hypothetical protein
MEAKLSGWLLLAFLILGCERFDDQRVCAGPTKKIWIYDYKTAGFLNSPSKAWRQVIICEGEVVRIK